MKKRIWSFEDLNVWQKSFALTLNLYQESVGFPKYEIFGLTSQMRRSAVSISSNIAEGFGRKKPRDKIYFYVIAMGSLVELKNQILIAEGLHYLSPNKKIAFLEELTEIHKMLHALASSLRFHLPP